MNETFEGALPTIAERTNENDVDLNATQNIGSDGQETLPLTQEEITQRNTAQNSTAHHSSEENVDDPSSGSKSAAAVPKLDLDNKKLKEEVKQNIKMPVGEYIHPPSQSELKYVFLI